MRCTLVLGLLSLMVTGVVGADKPIPQDIAKAEKKVQDRVEWNRRTLQGAYDKIGKRDPRWDKQAREAMEVAARHFGKPSDAAFSLADIHRTAKVAIDAGCDDPMVAYLYSRSSVGPDSPGKEESIRLRKTSAKALAASRYPVFRRAVALRRDASASLAEAGPSVEAKKAIQPALDAVLALVPESVASDERNEFWEDTWFDIMKYLISGYREVGLKDPEPYKRVDAKLAKNPELKVFRLQLRGFFWKAYGWEARTNAFASQVPAKAAEAFERRLEDARKAYEEAWRLRPGDASTAGALVEIDKAIGGDRANMELWFERAMTADANDRDTCWSKLDWLDPKWHGIPEEMLAFGRQCRDTKNWGAGITLLFCDAHLRYYGRFPAGERLKYLNSPEGWAQIKETFEEYLEHEPKDDVARSKFAVMCLLSVRFAEAHAQFEILGDRLVQWTEYPFYPLETMKKMRADAAAGVTQQKANAAKKGDGKDKPK